MLISQPNHRFDWSSVSSDSVELTSLSVDPDTGLISISRTLAYLADALNNAGLGYITNIVALASNFFEQSLYSGLISLSKNEL